MRQSEFDLPIVRHANNAVSRFIGAVVLTRGAVTPEQFGMLKALVVQQVRLRFDLSAKGAMQAVDPVLRTLIHVPKAEPTGVRRAV